MDILVIAPYFTPKADVSSVRITSLCTFLLKQGAKITIIRNEKYDKELQKLTDEDKLLLSLPTFKVSIQNAHTFKEMTNMYAESLELAMNKKKFDVVLITAGPFYTIPLCSIVKKKYMTPCILDYRDLWIFDIRRLRDFFKIGSILRKIYYFPTEFRSIEAADYVVTVTSNWKNILKKVYGIFCNNREEKFQIIFNGYDDNRLKDFERYGKPDNNKREDIVLSSFGKLAYYSPEYGELLFQAVEELNNSGYRVIVQHIGNEEKQIDTIKQKYDKFESYYFNTGFMDYGQGIQLLKDSRINIVVDIRNGAVGTKFYDYVYANRPLIYLGKKNTQLYRLVKELPSGYVCGNSNDVYFAVKDIIDREVDVLCDENTHAQYARSIQNERYFSLIKKAVNMNEEFDN